MFEQVRKQAVRGSGKRTFLAGMILLLGLTLTVWTSVTDLFPKNGPWSPMDNPDAYRIAEAAEQSRSVYMDLRQMPLYGTGFELGEGAFARAICLTSRDGLWFSVVTGIEVYDQMDDYGSAYGCSGRFRVMTDRKTAGEIADALREEYGFEEEFLPLVLEGVSSRSLWIEDGVLLLLGLIGELWGLRLLLGRTELRFSPAWRGLKRYGDPEQAAASIEGELSGCPIPDPMFTENWMILRRSWKGTVFLPFSDVVWCHKALIPGASARHSYSVVLYLKSRRRPVKWKVPSEAHADAVLQQAQAKNPQMDTRYNPVWEQIWKKNRGFFLQSPPCCKN